MHEYPDNFCDIEHSKSKFKTSDQKLDTTLSERMPRNRRAQNLQGTQFCT